MIRSIPALVLALFAAPDDPRLRVEVFEEEGEALCNVSADNALVFDVLEQIAAGARLEIDGVGAEVPKLLVTADLRRRPLRQALTYLAGSVGLRAEIRQGALVVRSDASASASRDETYDAALVGYLRVIRDFPEHGLAVDAQLNRAEIEKRRGRNASARANYDALVGQFPESPLVAQALFHAAELFQRDGEWREAVDRYSRVLRHSQRHGYEVRARLELAWCVAQLGEHERALYMIDALEVLQPPHDQSEELRRAYVRVRALAGLGDGVRALDLLEQVELRMSDASMKRESLELRARASAAAGQADAASRAWLAFGRMVEGADRTKALREAASWALASGQELGALFISALARDDGSDLGDLAHEARARLELDDRGPADATPLDRLAQAEELLASDPTARALLMLHSVEAQSDAFDESTRVRLALAIGRALAREVGADDALAYFREVLVNVQDPEERRRVYLLAGELLERDQRLDEAIEAYRGRI